MPSRAHKLRPVALLTVIAWIAVLHPSNLICADAKPLKVFVLAGQSNMQGHAHVRTFEHIGMSPETAPLLQAMQDDGDCPRVLNDVWISYLSSDGERKGPLSAGFGADVNKIGPEFTFGIVLHQMLGEPILLIKTAWGGKSLHTDFRPPSAGPFEFNESQLQNLKEQGRDLTAIQTEKQEATGRYYRLMIQHVRQVLSDIEEYHPDYESDHGYELAGFVWFQGWNDMVDRGVYPNRDQTGGYDAYSETLSHFIHDVRRDLNAPDLPFVIGVLGVGGPVDQYGPDQQRYRDIHQNFRDAMAAPANQPEFQDNVAAVLTEKYWDRELSELKAREAAVKEKVKKLQSEQKLTQEQAKAMEQELREKEFSKREIKSLETGISNFEFHYLGSAKIMAQIGIAFAEAMESLLPDQ